jgi:hypothetical protein
MMAAATVLNAETRSVATMTNVVAHAAKRGPRTSTRCGPAVMFDTRMLLMLSMTGCEQATKGCSERGAKERARLLSSYNNNSSNPRRGTDQLRGAW